MVISTTHLGKKNILEAISISKLIVSNNLMGKRLSQKDDEKANLENYHSLITPPIEHFKSNNGGDTPNQLLKLVLNDFLSEKGYSDEYEVTGFHYYRQIINSYVWAAITKKDKSTQDKKASRHPQLYILINNFDIHFGFGYGYYVKEDDKCVLLVKKDDGIKRQIIELLDKNRNLHIFSSYDHNHEIVNPEIELNTFKEIEDKWTKDIHILEVIKENEITDSIDGEIKNTLNILFELFLKISEPELTHTIKPELPPKTAEYPQITKLLNTKKQLIFYGPPGTGKTYIAKDYIDTNSSGVIETKRRTVENTFFWLTINPKKWDPEKLFSDKETKLSFGTRLKPAFANIEEGNLLFMYVSAPVKKMTAVAECCRIEENSEGKREIFIRGLKHADGPKWAEFKEDDILSTSLPVRTGARGTLFPLTNDEGMHLLEKCHLKLEDLNQEASFDTERIANTRFVTFHPSFAYEDFIEGLRPEADDDGAIHYKVVDGVFKEFARQSFNALLTEAGIEKEWLEGKSVPKLDKEERDSALEAVQKVPFYLIIDEINRGDIARILGELITLLEADKRLCAENELTTTLPYSKTRFGIPPNLFILGTMNTADKSIALVDIALRRRFGFIEMMPDSDVLRKLLVSDNPEVQEIFDTAIGVLEKVNDEILEKYDRDHQIGHSYFVKLIKETTQEGACEALEFIWYHEVMPLLQEYFYDSPKKLSEILGKDFVTLGSEGRSFTFTEPCQSGVFIAALNKLAKLEKIPASDD